MLVIGLQMIWKDNLLVGEFLQKIKSPSINLLGGRNLIKRRKLLLLLLTLVLMALILFLQLIFILMKEELLQTIME